MIEPSTADVLDAIAAANERFVKLASDVCRWSGVTAVHHALTLTPFRAPGDVLLDVYVDAELSHGPGLVWALGAWWRPDWGVEATLRFVYGEDAEEIVRFSPRRSADLENFLGDVGWTVDALVAAAQQIDLATFLRRLPDPDGGTQTPSSVSPEYAAAGS